MRDKCKHDPLLLEHGDNLVVRDHARRKPAKPALSETSKTGAQGRS
jgi:hypothetical protein